jgi:hypothetical protein
MARDGRRAVLAALAAATIGGACVLAAHAQAPAEDEPEQAARGAPQKAGKKGQDPAEAQRTIEAALKQLQAGRAEQAVQAMTTTLGGGNLPPAMMAKAFYVRGMAHRQLGRPAHALSDLSSALWLKGGLGGDERADATKEKAAAYADAGLAGRGEAEIADARKKPSGGNWLSGLFASSDPPPRPPKATAPVERVEAPVAKAPPPVPSGWSSKTELAAAPAAEPPKADAAPPPRAVLPRTEPAPPPADPPARADGRYLVQLAAVRTEAEAQAMAARAKREQAALLGSREVRIDRVVVGNMGAFYRARLGPFASSDETEMVCVRLQGTGIDCMTVSQ